MADEPREYHDSKIDFSLCLKSRKELMKAVIMKFLNEDCGYWERGTKHVMRYRYYVETLNDGRRIYLYRPARLNKGMDFQVYLERMDGRADKMPSHKNIFDDLRLKKQENAKEYSKLMMAIDRVWHCEEPNDVLKDLTFSFKKGLPTDALLKILKWLFIEQDVTYWNWDGRMMLLRAISNL